MVTMFLVKTETSQQIQRRIAEELYDGESAVLLRAKLRYTLTTLPR